METISVIVPVYNAEKYLRQCLDSIINSTYEELEIILVNDGSVDSSESICEEYELKDSRIQVINQCNKGISAARNAGLNRAKGKYIGFVDADDVVTQEFFEKMVYAIETTGADWSACGYYTEEAKLIHHVSNTEVKEEIQIIEGIENQISVITVAPAARGMTWTGMPIWNKLYKKSKIHYDFVENRLMGEDLEFNINYCKMAKKMALINKAYYFYRQTDTSIMGNYRKKTEIKKGISSAELWIRIAKDSKYYKTALKKYLEGRAAYMAHGALWRLYALGEDKANIKFVEDAKECIAAYWKETWKDKDTYSLKIRGAVLVNRFCFPMWVALVKVIK